MNAEILALNGFIVAALLWFSSALVDLFKRGRQASWLLMGGVVIMTISTVLALWHGCAEGRVPFADGYVHFSPERMGLWLLLPALLPAFFSALGGGKSHPPGWVLGASLSLLGALGIIGLHDGASLLIAWEALSLGGAIMLLAERNTAQSGRDNLFMLALLEVGSVALLLAVLMVGKSLDFSSYGAQWQALSPVLGFVLALLWLIGFGAKLGLLPFYEWYPGAYAQGSGNTNALMSGVIMNAAFFALGRALFDWLGNPTWLAGFGVSVLAIGTLTAILSILYAFQQNNWRRLLAFSSAENAAVAVTALGAALIFRAGGQEEIAQMAWLVGMLHMMGHSLAKGALFFSADAVVRVSGSDHIRQNAVLHRAPFTLGIGAVFAVMSLAALPPTAGFVSEWYLFQTLFHDFTLHNDGLRIALALAGGGLALTAAIALATMVKVFGVGLLGQVEVPPPHAHTSTGLDRSSRMAILLTGLAVPVLAISLVFWLPELGTVQTPEAHSMVSGWLLVPLSNHFAFISPAMLVIVMPLLALIPLALIWMRRRVRVRRAPLWCGGERHATHAGATTALAFSNALRVFYSFVYRPTNEISRQYEGQSYFLKELKFDYAQAPIFGSLLFQPALRLVAWLAAKMRFLQNGLMNAYLAYIGVLLVLVFLLALVW